jgi:excisionase family DNA binding protein
MSIPSTGVGDLGPLVVPPKVAWAMIGCSNSFGYELLNAGELDSIRLGRARRITVESIHRFIERRLAAGKSEAA